MALKHRTPSSNEKKRQIFTFYVDDMLFGLNIENVLMLGQDISSIQRLPIEEQGFCGTTHYQGNVTPVLDFAHRMGVSSGIDTKHGYLDNLSQYEQANIDWFDSLERAIRDDSLVDITTPKHEAFLLWYKKLCVIDETFVELLAALEQAKSELNTLQNELRSLGRHDASVSLESARNNGFRRLLTVFSRIREQVQSTMRQVLLFVTDDGISPRYALLIDDVNDVINYSDSDYHLSHKGALSSIPQINAVIDGIYTKRQHQDCFFFNLDKIADSRLLNAAV